MATRSDERPVGECRRSAERDAELGDPSAELAYPSADLGGVSAELGGVGGGLAVRLAARFSTL
ncbi:hypothetical protein SAMN05421630_11211 [Prauserella marina]|uniref:Uncharacterized protein n=1 Tax=Prauserella marina TaxID=530584 RepID=A0A1G6XEB5_9PSEU|nr:hypothetical protein [Prauserella marina]PWV72626.1 hypothetical protein DES30_110227 [Prauserella marina]SDD75707.1 hypothetical protein SAMN05421630_11211 [Prauserella marina]